MSCKGRLGERGSAFLRRGSGLLLTEWGVDGERDFGPEHVSDVTWTHLGVSGSQSQAFILCLLLVIVPSIGASLSGLRTGSIFSHVTLGGQPQAPGHHILDKTSRMVHTAKLKSLNTFLFVQNRNNPLSIGCKAPKV